MDQTARLIDQNQRAPSVRESRLRFLPGGSRNTMRLLDADAEPPPTTCIAMETAEVARDLGRCHITERGQLLLWDSPLQRARLPLLQQQIQELKAAPADQEDKDAISAGKNQPARRETEKSAVKSAQV